MLDTARGFLAVAFLFGVAACVFGILGADVTGLWNAATVTGLIGIGSALVGIGEDLKK